jgi:hypothetical protein
VKPHGGYSRVEGYCNVNATDGWGFPFLVAHDPSTRNSDREISQLYGPCSEGLVGAPPAPAM